MRFIDAETVEANLSYPGLMDALESAHRHEPPLVGRSVLAPAPGTRPEGEGFVALPCWSPGQAFGVKMATIMPENAQRKDKLPSIQGVYQLFDGETGTPTMTIDGTALTLKKTSADSGLGSRLLSREDSSTLLMVGAGALALPLISAHVAARPGIERVMIWNRTPSRCDAVIEQYAGEIEAVDDLNAAVSKSDIITVATMSSEPLVMGQYLKPGTHVDLVGGYMPTMREADDETMRRARIYVNYWETTIPEVGDLTQPLKSGVIEESDVLGDLFDLCPGRAAGRQSASDITVYKNGGGGHLDLFTAQYLARCLNEN
jgi:ornithine cyclodeaminase/alanine dehydrogenase-like protein (mu-crystallin family)